MFELVKSKVNLLEHLTKDLQLTFKVSGENTYSIEDEQDYGGCPFCSHNGCFKVKHDEENLTESFYKCFSCDAHGSIIDWVSCRNKLAVVEAARKLAKDYNINLPKDYSPIQELFNIAASYYETCLRETCAKPQTKLAKMKPVEYQLNVRKHKDETLKHFTIGWSDGGLISFLESLGYDNELLNESGLKNKKGYDFLPSDCFIYPHFIKGKVSHFTFKDPVKKLNYQLPNKYVLNNACFYNQDSIKEFDTIIVVEGENDVLSVFENTSKYGVIGTIGQISVGQLDWMREHLSTKHIITMFDPDEAGDKYRSKVEKIKNSFKSLVQVKPPNDKDVDDHLTDNADLEGLIASNTIKVEIKAIYSPPLIPNSQESSSSASEDNSEAERDSSNDNGSFLEKQGCYWGVKYKDGEPTYSKVSNFVIQLKNVYETEEGDREREIIVVRQDGYKSNPIRISSEVKVSLRAFRVFLARAADCDFLGSEFQLSAMWSLVYSKAPEVLVKISRIAGRNDRNRGWIFRNKFISDNGVVIDPDESGIFWLNGKSVGLKIESLNKSTSSDDITDIPYLEADNSPEERDELLQGFIDNLSLNLGDLGMAILMTAWMNSCAYSNTIHPAIKGFPMLFLWSTNGQGKGTIGSWLMNLWSMFPDGKTTVIQLKSGVGFGRKLEYYASLPLWVDEIRSDRGTQEYLPQFRSYFDREARSMGHKDGFGIKSQSVRACVMFAGEDYFEDPATKERCVVLRLPILGREKVSSFQWMDGNKEFLSSIGYKWILESVNEDHKQLMLDIKNLDRDLIVEAGCSSRKSKLWAVVGIFALRLAEKYAPGFPMKEYLFKVSSEDSNTQKAETTVSQFFERIASIQSQEGIPKITIHHIVTEGNLMHIWFPHVYRVVNDSYSGNFAFSKNAVLAAIKEEPYYVSDNKKIQMGLSGVRRVVITLDLTKCPDEIKNISLGSN